jgi:hypothetical protein
VNVRTNVFVGSSLRLSVWLGVGVSVGSEERLPLIEWLLERLYVAKQSLYLLT